jgi:hypothetical protein
VRGHVPEFLKAPVLLASVVSVYAATNSVLEESGLLTVTVMGVVLANSRIASLTDMRRFKETITTLLVSGVFIILTASLSMDDIRSLDWQPRCSSPPSAGHPSGRDHARHHQIRRHHPGADPDAWIAPRGVVAVAVSGLFGTLLADAGVEDAGRMVAFTFAVVVTTIVLHGFTLKPARRLPRPQEGLQAGHPDGWRFALVDGPRCKLKEADVPVMLADQNWNHLAEARLASIPGLFRRGPVRSGAPQRSIPSASRSLIATSDNDAYNALVCTDFGPELGRNHVFQIGRIDEKARQSLSFTLGGRPLDERTRQLSRSCAKNCSRAGPSS